MPDVTLTTLQGLKQKGEIVMLTCYDATFAKTACDAGVEMLLIGDSLGMVLQGHDSTLPVTVADMAYHTASVKRGNRGAMIVADLPFMANATTEQTLNNSALLMQAGAHDQARGHRLASRVDPPAGRPRHPGVRTYGADPAGGQSVRRLQGAGARRSPGTADAGGCQVAGSSRRRHAAARMRPQRTGRAHYPGRADPGDRHWRRQRYRRPGAGPA